MITHKLLQRQVSKYLPENYEAISGLSQFLAAINDSYSAYDRDKEIVNHAYSVSEEEYKVLYTNLKEELELKRISIDRLKNALQIIDSKLEVEQDNLLGIADYINEEIEKRKSTELDLTRTLQLLVTLVSSMHSGIMVANEEDKIVFTNRIFCEMFMIPAEPKEMVGYDCQSSAEEAAKLFVDEVNFLKRIDELKEERKDAREDVLYMKDGRVLEREYIPIYLDGEFKGHLWEYTDVTERKRAEASLLEITRLQEAILNGTDYSIIYTDPEGIIQSFNKGAEKMLGYKACEMIGKQSPAVFHEETEIARYAVLLSEQLKKNVQPGFNVFIEKSLRGEVDTKEWTYIKKDGERLTVSLSVSTIKNAENNIVGHLGIARDITKQKRADEALKKSEERYRNMVEKSSDIIYKTNAAGYFTYMNPVGERITGYSLSELRSIKYSELIREDERDDAFAFYWDQLQSKKQSTYYEFPVITKSGEEKWIGQSVQLFETSAGDIEFTALAIDITDRIYYERSIHLQKEKYRSIIANMNLGLMETDMNDIIQYVNPSFLELSGYTEADLLGKSAIDIFISEVQNQLIEEKIRLRKQGISDMYELPVKRKNGELRWWMVSGAPNFDEKGNLVGSIGIHLDITEQKQMELDLDLALSKAEESSKAKESFLANMSHEIRTPLNAIIGMIRELKKESLSGTQDLYVKNLSVASEHLLSVLNNILDLSKIEAGELPIEALHFDFAEIVNDVKSMLINKAAEKNIYIRINHPEKKNTCFIGDPARFRQVLLNLAGNAIKFTQNGGVSITYDVIKHNRNYNSLVLKISDTGIGMDEDYLDKIFKKFTQEDASTSRKYGGTGLGMPITHELVQLMNGTISVKSKKAEGTVFELAFLLPEGEKEKIFVESDIEINSELGRIEILLVEDNEFNRHIAINTLKNFDCVVTEACDGTEAVEFLKNGNRYDIILMDLQMPLMDGFFATDIIRNQLKLQTPIVALTANAFKSELERCLAIGMNDCVTKPFEEHHLLAVINKLLDKQRKESTLNTITLVQPGEEKLYSFNSLISMSRNDMDYVKKMALIFIDQANLAVTDIRNAYQKNDLITVSKIAHRIYPSVCGLEINSLKTKVRDVEREAAAGNNSAHLRDDIDFLCSVLLNVVSGMREEPVFKA